MRQIFKTVMLAACVALLLPLTADGQVRYKLNKEKITVQLHTNGLYDLALCPNIGLELQTDLGIAWQCDYIGAWWSNNSKHRYWQNYAFQTELRYYLGNDNQDAPFFGHHVGVYGQLATYDFEFGGTGYQCNRLDNSWGVGIAYGYLVPLSPNFSVDFTIGLGYFHSKYTQYVPNNDWYKATDWKKMNWFGPTRMEVTFVWNINNKNVLH